MADALATVGVPKFSVNAGYIYSTFNPYTLFDQPPPPPPGHRLLHAAQRDHARRLVELGELSVQRLGPAQSSIEPDGRRSAAMRPMKTSAISWISGSIRRYTSFNGDQRRDDGAGPDDLQDNRTVRLQGALTLRRSRSWPTRTSAWCALALLLAQPRRGASLRTPAAGADGTGDADRRGGEWRRDQQCRCRQPHPAVRAVHRPADDAGCAGSAEAADHPPADRREAAHAGGAAPPYRGCRTRRSPMRSTTSRRAMVCRQVRCGRSSTPAASASAR